MAQNSNDNSWRADWVIDKKSRTALHKSGAIARIKDKLILDHTDKVDLTRWNLEQLTGQAIELWMYGEI